MAKIVLSELLFNVRADTNEFQKAMRRTQKQFEKLGKEIAGVGEKLTKAFAPVTAALTGLSIAGARYANTLDDVASKLGVNAESLQVLRVAADEGSVSNERLEKGLRNIADRTILAAQGNKSYQESIEALGFSTEDFMKLPLERKFEAVGRAYANATDKAKAHEAVMKLVGTMSGPELIKTLNAVGIEGFDALAIRARAAGMVLSQEATARIADFVGKLDQLKIRLQVLGAEIANRLIKAWDGLNARFGITDKIQALTVWFGNLSDETKDLALAFGVVASVSGPLIFVAGKLITAFAPMIGIASKIVAGFKGIGAAVGLALGPITLIIGAVATATAAVFAFTGALDGIGESLVGERLTLQLKIFSANLLTTAADFGLEMVKQITMLPRYFTSALGAAVAWVTWQFDNGLVDKIFDAANTVKDLIGKAFVTVANTFGDVIKGVFNVFVNSVKQEINWLIAQANKIPGVNMDKLSVDPSAKTIQGVVSDALSGLADSLFSPREHADSFSFQDDFLRRMGDGKTGLPGLISDAQKSLKESTASVVAGYKEQIETLRSPVNEMSAAASGFTAALTEATGAIKVEYSDEQKQKAQQTVDDIKSGKLSTTKTTRLEAEAILRGESIKGESARFRSFAGGGQSMDRSAVAAASPGTAAVQNQVQQRAQQGKGSDQSGGMAQLAAVVQQLVSAVQTQTKNIEALFPGTSAATA